MQCRAVQSRHGLLARQVRRGLHQGGRRRRWRHPSQGEDVPAQRHHRHRGQHHRLRHLRVAHRRPQGDRLRQRLPHRVDRLRGLLHGEQSRVLIFTRQPPRLHLLLLDFT